MSSLWKKKNVIFGFWLSLTMISGMLAANSDWQGYLGWIILMFAQGFFIVCMSGKGGEE